MDWSRMLTDDPAACGLQHRGSQLQGMVLLLASWWIKSRTHSLTLIQGESTTTAIRHKEEFHQTDSEIIIASQILGGLSVSGGTYIVRKQIDFPRIEELSKKAPAVGNHFSFLKHDPSCLETRLEGKLGYLLQAYESQRLTVVPVKVERVKIDDMQTSDSAVLFVDHGDEAAQKTGSQELLESGRLVPPKVETNFGLEACEGSDLTAEQHMVDPDQSSKSSTEDVESAAAVEFKITPDQVAHDNKCLLPDEAIDGDSQLQENWKVNQPDHHPKMVTGYDGWLRLSLGSGSTSPELDRSLQHRKVLGFSALPKLDSLEQGGSQRSSFSPRPCSPPGRLPPEVTTPFVDFFKDKVENGVQKASTLLDQYGHVLPGKFINREGGCGGQSTCSDSKGVSDFLRSSTAPGQIFQPVPCLPLPEACPSNSSTSISLPWRTVRVLQPLRTQQTQTTSVHPQRGPQSTDEAGPSLYHKAEQIKTLPASLPSWMKQISDSLYTTQQQQRAFRDWKPSIDPGASSSVQVPKAAVESDSQAWRRDNLQRVGDIDVGLKSTTCAGDPRGYLEALARAVERFQEHEVPKGDTAARIQLLDGKNELALERSHHGAMSTPIKTTHLVNTTKASGSKSGRTQMDISGQKRKRILRSAAPTSGLWFTLESSESQVEGSSNLQQIPRAYIRVKDDNMTVSAVKKYLVHKLGLTNENEVEIKCKGQPLVPSLPLQQVRDGIWQVPNTTTTPAKELSDSSLLELQTQGKVWTSDDGSTAHVEDMVLVLTYGWHPLRACDHVSI